MDRCVGCTGQFASFKDLGVHSKLCLGVWHKCWFSKTMLDEQREWTLAAEKKKLSGEEFIPNSDIESEGTVGSDNKRSSTPVPNKNLRHTVLNKAESVTAMSTELANSVDLGQVYALDETKTFRRAEVGVTRATQRQVFSSSMKCSGKNYCYVCRKPQSKITRHFKRHEKVEFDIARALSLPKGSKQRKELLEQLRNKGNFQHNSDVLSKGTGPLKLKRRPKKDVASKDYEHCVYCRGLFVRRELWRHVSRCSCKPELEGKLPRRNRVLGLGSAVVIAHF